jgi:hypothetical protein
MLTRTTALAAALTIATFGFASVPAQAQPQYFGVQSTSQTLGYVGTYTNDSQWQPGSVFASSLSDPAGATLSGTNGSGYADVGAGSEAQIAELHAWASGHAHVISKQFSSAAPYGFAYSYFYDRVTVKSNVLPVGTPVTIVFGNDVTINRWDRVNLYDGYIDMTLQIGLGTARSRWSSSYLYGDTTAVAPQVQIKTTVGSTLSVDAKLRVMAKVFYYDPAVASSADNYADATARLVIREIPEGVTLQAASGTVYPIVPAVPAN